MKFTKPITLKTGIELPAALFSLKSLNVDIFAKEARIVISIFKDVEAEGVFAEILSAPYPREFVVRDYFNDEGQEVKTFTNQVLPAMMGQNMMSRIRSFIKVQVGASDCVDVDSDT